MSNSNLKGFYNSFPAGYRFQISTMNEANGAFSGKYEKQKNGVVENISGSFYFNKEKQQTDLNFLTSTEKFVMVAAYHSGEKYFETWHGSRTSKVDGSVQQLEFNVNLSGESRSWFGAVGSVVPGGQDL